MICKMSRLCGVGRVAILRVAKISIVKRGVCLARPLTPSAKGGGICSLPSGRGNHANREKTKAKLLHQTS